MTNTPMSEREAELVEASLDDIQYNSRIERALRAYDPKPEKEYTMPEWDELQEVTRRDIINVLASITGTIPNGANGKVLYASYRTLIAADNYRREALSKPKAPTE